MKGSTCLVTGAGSGIGRAIAVRFASKGARVAINDLHRLTSAFEPALFRAPGDVHYTDEGSLLIAQQVAAHIREALARKKMQQQRQRPTATRI